MPRYDGIRTSYQLGNDLQIGPTTGGNTVDPNEESSGPLVSLCLHRGSRFAAWTEKRFDGVSSGSIYGPFVKRYDLASDLWVQIGDVEPGLTAVDAFSAWDSIPSGLALGTRFFPSRPQLVSDGTNLYVVYSLHETIAQHSTTLSPMKLVVRRWDGSAWELYGEIPAVGRNESTAAAVFNLVTAAASPHDSGACYVTLVQSGETGPFTLGSPILYQGVVARFDGSSLAGTVHVIGTPNTNPSYFDTGSTLIDKLSVRYDDADGPWVWWLGELSVVHGFAGTPNWYLQRFDGTIVQQWDSTLDSSPIQTASSGQTIPLGYEAGAWLTETFLTDEPTDTIRYLIADGSSALTDALDGEPEIAYAPTADRFHPETQPHFGKLVSEPPNNIWAVDYGGSLPGAIWLYHRPCRAWTRVFQQSTVYGEEAWQLEVDPLWPAEDRAASTGYFFNAGSIQSGHLDFILDSGKLVVAGWVFNVLASEGHLRVYEVPIQRNLFRCRGIGVYLAPYSIPLGNEPIRSAK